MPMLEAQHFYFEIRGNGAQRYKTLMKIFFFSPQFCKINRLTRRAIYFKGTALVYIVCFLSIPKKGHNEKNDNAIPINPISPSKDCPGPELFNSQKKIVDSVNSDNAISPSWILC